jgi:nucleolar protein 56
MEMLRGCRMHLDRFVKGLKEGDLGKAQLGLAHSYSRAKVKFNVNRADNMIIQVPPSLSSRSPPRCIF